MNNAVAGFREPRHPILHTVPRAVTNFTARKSPGNSGLWGSGAGAPGQDPSPGHPGSGPGPGLELWAGI